MVNKALAILALAFNALAFTACTYGPELADCTVRCAGDTGRCPDDMTCGSEGFCRVSGAEAATTCTGFPVGGGSGSGSGSGTGPNGGTLTETVGTLPAAGLLSLQFFGPGAGSAIINVQPATTPAPGAFDWNIVDDVNTVLVTGQLSVDTISTTFNPALPGTFFLDMRSKLTVAISLSISVETFGSLVFLGTQ